MSRRQLSGDPQIKRIIRQAQRSGWTVSYTGSGHLRFRSPSGKSVFTPSTPNGGNRALMNMKATLKREGLEVTL